LPPFSSQNKKKRALSFAEFSGVGYNHLKKYTYAIKTESVDSRGSLLSMFKAANRSSFFQKNSFSAQNRDI